MEKKCKGCGILLQNNDSKSLGYVPNLEMDICQRCFRIMHYDAHDKDIKFFDNYEIIKDLSNLEGTFIWIIDIFDLENSFHSLLCDFFKNHDCVIIFNKMDLLPININPINLKKKLINRLRNLNIKFVNIIYRDNNNSKEFFDIFNFKIIENIGDTNYVFCGCGNVGKSTIINSLLDHDILTVNRYPATSIQLHRIHTTVADFIDTIGIVNENNAVSYLSTNDLKVVVPINPVRNKMYQIEEPQSIIIGGLVKLDIYPIENCSVGVYCSNLLKQYRGKVEKANNYFKREYNKDFKPAIGKHNELKEEVITLKKKPKDIVINGIGWFSIYGKIEKVVITTNEKISIYTREVLI